MASLKEENQAHCALLKAALVEPDRRGGEEKQNSKFGRFFIWPLWLQSNHELDAKSK